MLRKNILSRVSMLALMGMILGYAATPGWAMEKQEDNTKYAPAFRAPNLPEEAWLKIFGY